MNLRAGRDTFTGTRPRRPSFTLVELLAALALTALVVAVTGRIALHGVETREVVTDLVTQVERDAAIFTLIHADFASLLSGLPGDETPVKIFGTPRQVLQLSVLSAVAGNSEALHVARRPATVRYRLVGERDDDGFDLVREVIDRTDAGVPPIGETIARHLASFELEVFVKGKWEPSQPAKRGIPETARAVRVTLRRLGRDEPVTRTFVVPFSD